MKVKILRYQIDSNTNKKTTLEESDFESESNKSLTATRARKLLRRALPDWTSHWNSNEGWPYLYKFRDDRGKVFKAQKATGEPCVKGSYHHIWEYVEIWEGVEKPKPKRKSKPSAPRTKKATTSSAISDDSDESPVPTSPVKA